MISVKVCIGSSCHIQGSRQIVEELQALIAENGLGDAIELGGSLCVGECERGVCVTVDGELFSVSPDGVSEFFNRHVAARVK